MKRLLAPLLLLLTPYLYGEVTFSGLDLSPSNHLLFQARTDAPAYGRYATLFESNLEKKSLRQLTFFPEQASLVDNRQELQIQNRFGVFRTNTKLRDMKSVGSFPSFVSGHGIETGKIATASASPDGNYLLYFRQTDFGHADLVLYTVSTGKAITVAQGVGYTLSEPPALWSPDSSYFVYSAGGKLYYYSMDQLKQNRVMAASLRVIGDGTIANVTWGADGNLYYVASDVVYRVAGPELFTRSIYSSLISIGSVAGKIPFRFDPNFDRFWISPDGSSILFAKNGRTLLAYPLRASSLSASSAAQPLPALLLPRNFRVERVLWSQDGIVTVLTRDVMARTEKSRAFRLNLFANSGRASFSELPESDIRSIVLSPDGSKVAVLSGAHVVVRDYRTWREIASFPQPDPLHALWLSNDHLVVAGGRFTELYSLSDKSSEVVSISQPGSYGFRAGTDTVETRLEGRSLALENGTASSRAESNGSPAGGGVNWTPVPSFSIGKPAVASQRYRVYTDTAESMSYTNIVMVREVEGLGTKPLFPYPKTRYEAFPKSGGPVNFTDFTHGSRLRRREVALVFNAVSSADGLNTVLKTLKEYGLHCTFFVNGEFMRRNPEAVRELAASGQQVGSLFFTYFNMTDSRYRIDATFVEDGLARTEDDYYALTGKELSLLWHAPYYFTDSSIIKAAGRMNYTYIGRDVDPLDWVTKNDGLRGTNIYLSVADIIDRVMRLKKPGSIVPIRIGRLNGQRDSYLWSRLDVLINDLLSLGYTIVPVTTLIEHAH